MVSRKKYLPHISARLAGRGQELNARHPLLGAQTGFTGEVMEMGHQPFEHISEPQIWIIGIDKDDVFGYVFDGQILERR